ncbi:Helix-turn-helix domain protein [Carbonactinospora thermoautotrophica]|uniref:Helix-turn-helix domain protein n=1 Tax=Carbonactinospora thermoautotrophica TaxID=1469144 RepID=A0A132MV77_9ACTN|nr:helix-turn-helix transcriptional regulator [Carbonactinospora thermoautotrophica]KWX01749.1 Helix-turn-helix domain protein [Carbonactinospora thermoautotrophica]
MPTMVEPIDIPASAWRREETRRALRARDVAAVLRITQQFSGASQARIAAAVGLTQGRLNEILNGRRDVVRLDVFERIADGLGMPDEARVLFGLAPKHATDRTDCGEVAKVFRFQAAAADEIRDRAKAATRVEILAVRGLGILALNDSLLRPALTDTGDRTVSVRVLLLDPDSPAAERRAAEIGESVEAFTGGIRVAEARLRELADLPGISLEVYRYRTLPVWRMIGIDGTLFVSVFGEEWEGHESPVYEIRETPDGALYRGFRRHFEAMRADAQRVI